jgi:hypothetical protein
MSNFIEQIWPRPRGYWDKKDQLESKETKTWNDSWFYFICFYWYFDFFHSSLEKILVEGFQPVCYSMWAIQYISKIGSNWPSDFREEQQYVKILQVMTMDTKWWQYLTWPLQGSYMLVGAPAGNCTECPCVKTALK